MGPLQHSFSKGKNTFYSHVLAPFPLPHPHSSSETDMEIAQNAEPTHHITGGPRNISNHLEE